MIPTVLLIVAVLVLALAVWAYRAAHARLRRRLDAAPRVADARRDLTAATADWTAAAARADAIRRADAALPGFGDSQVLPAKLRRALAQLEQEQQ